MPKRRVTVNFLCSACLSQRRAVWQRPSPLSLVALLLASSPRGGAIGMSASFRLDEQSTISRKQKCSAVQASDSLTRSVVQKPLSP